VFYIIFLEKHIVIEIWQGLKYLEYDIFDYIIRILSDFIFPDTMMQSTTFILGSGFDIGL